MSSESDAPESPSSGEQQEGDAVLQFAFVEYGPSFPMPREQMKTHLKENTAARSVAETMYGVLIKTRPTSDGDTFGGMARDKGWIVDYVVGDRELVHVVPLPQEGDDE